MSVWRSLHLYSLRFVGSKLDSPMGTSLVTDEWREYSRSSLASLGKIKLMRFSERLEERLKLLNHHLEVIVRLKYFRGSR